MPRRDDGGTLVKQTWYVEYSHNQNVFHIGLSDNPMHLPQDPEWKTIGVVTGTFREAQEYATQWRKEQGAKA